MSPTPHRLAVRPAVQADRFYPGDPHTLSEQIKSYLEEPGSVSARAEDVVGLLVPHAGYVYSGRVAGATYRAIRGQALDRVLLLGPSHYVSVSGAALADMEAFATPLGRVALDREAAARLSESEAFFFQRRSPHAGTFP